MPDETTICKFRHLLEAHALGPQLFAAVNQQLAAQGLGVSRGTIVDATIISAPASTKNQAHARDPEMRSTKKGNQWYFGMKAHVGVDSQTKLIHSVVATAASVHDSQVLPQLLHGRERRVWGDRAYAGQRPAIAAAAPQARDFTHRKGYRHRPLSERDAARNRLKSKVRAKVEHTIGVIKRIFGFTTVRYRGLAKNTHRLWVTCALANLFMARRILLRATSSRDGGAICPLSQSKAARQRGPRPGQTLVEVRPIPSWFGWRDLIRPSLVFAGFVSDVRRTVGPTFD